VLTGGLRSQIDGIWNSFWSGGISNPLEVMEQLTYLLFLKRLDDLQTLDENRANRLGEPVTRIIFPAGTDDKGRSYQDFRWSRFKHLAPAEMYAVVGEHVFPFLRTLGGEGSTYATHSLRACAAFDTSSRSRPTAGPRPRHCRACAPAL
jgi:type I restriction enzyme M protein